MKKRFSDEQIISILRKAEAGVSARQQAFADTTINFSGTLVSAPNCTVNTNNAVDVDFGDMVNKSVCSLNICNSATTEQEITALRDGKHTPLGYVN